MDENELHFDDVKDLARAIRLGDRDQAESILDRIVDEQPNAHVLHEAVSQGRFCSATRKAA
jgi:Tfp pilus assembly protein FimV